MNVNSIIIIVAAYLVGSIPFAIIVSRLFKLKDPRAYGSKNPGATNVMRSGSKWAALCTLLGDTLKGWLIVFLATYYMSLWNINALTVAAVSVAVVLGHMFPIFFKFQGGKGVATALGVIFAFCPSLAWIMCGIWLILFFATKLSSLSALTVYFLCPLLSFYFLDENAYQWAIVVISILVFIRHKDNIINLLQNKEKKIG